MKGYLRVVTFSNVISDAITNLQEDCDRIKTPLSVLGVGVKWISNVQKLRLLKDFLISNSEEELLLVIDAFDVRIVGSRESIEAKVHNLEGTILFGAEANYFFNERALALEYWNKYPRNGTYHYLNSGTFIGENSHILLMIDDIISKYKIDLDNDEQLVNISSDQYLYSRYYVDSFHDSSNCPFQIKIDSEQQLFGCSGGAMGVVKWPVFNSLHQYYLFREERKLIKTFYLRSFQINARDLALKDQKIVNIKTGEQPDIIHLPGTHHNFELAWNLLNDRKAPSRWYFTRFIAIPISFLGYVFSLIKFLTSTKPS